MPYDKDKCRFYIRCGSVRCSNCNRVNGISTLHGTKRYANLCPYLEETTSIGFKSRPMENYRVPVNFVPYITYFASQHDRLKDITAYYNVRRNPRGFLLTDLEKNSHLESYRIHIGKPDIDDINAYQEEVKNYPPSTSGGFYGYHSSTVRFMEIQHDTAGAENQTSNLSVEIPRLNTITTPESKTNNLLQPIDAPVQVNFLPSDLPLQKLMDDHAAYVSAPGVINQVIQNLQGEIALGEAINSIIESEKMTTTDNVHYPNSNYIVPDGENAINQRIMHHMDGAIASNNVTENDNEALKNLYNIGGTETQNNDVNEAFNNIAVDESNVNIYNINPSIFDYAQFEQEFNNHQFK